uniref:Profilin n=1 Tax=Chromera velia CCMP2878 TaxID=1169474 RepID=A0A0G4FVZ4_9ALVE|mmetsp:Transcript_11191/g.21667  ORF Transcript_11191/g.21667 Transcript_11191/m.21667 type:complete len:155 (+) Transcript_11191:87-551(+)|eukprot:Cvel_18957.t1-p1 / transcript=Cvel_18957.t1 / gene=Cvel_18957 / organism=Chromera_velia_CCMP2878 / gene_product=Profilin, putative / transcript_product=Profilin, putative / location=Cvel_scaffold1602:25637-26098(+) / protein_length=154 / sequence_SO=supercontig / SO=protein_coding / is_pseudo=false
MAEGDWNSVVKEWLVDPGWCDSGGLAGDDGCLYAAAPEDKMWQSIYDQEVTGDDFQPTTINVNEPETLQEMISKKGPTKIGVWLAGKKYTYVKSDQIEGFDVVVMARQKGGLFIVLTGAGTAVLATFDEEQEMTSGNCCETAIGFAKYLKESGY